MAMVKLLMMLSAGLFLSKRVSSHCDLSLKMEENKDDRTTRD